ncbi:uncharacterized protein LOC134819026 isoform X2 [Bolinopsis microptera]|uniref:uncharacterized protein LOC134819026 isoform X2 n=1 Tax=Bolinopsis microptera TaxID=2820187 RepID=UPI003078E8D0
MPKCPSNPHFYNWIKELRDDAKEKDNKSYHSYSRSMKALCSYPIPLRSGEEAKSIQHIGDKIARMLDKKTVQFYKERGYRESEIQHFMIACALEKLPTVREKMKKELLTKNRKRKKTTPLSSPSQEEFDNVIQQIERETSELISTSSSNNISNSKKKCKRERIEIVSSPVKRSSSPSLSPVKRGTKPEPFHYRKSPCFTPIKIEEEQKARGTLSSGESQPGPAHPSINLSRSPSPILGKSPPTNFSQSHSPILGKSPSPIHIKSLSPSTNSATYTAPVDPVDVSEPDSPDPGLSEPPPGEWRFTYLDENNNETVSRSRAAFLESNDMTGLWLRVKTYSSTLGHCDKLYVEEDDQHTNHTKHTNIPDTRYKVIHVEVSYCPLKAPGLPRLKALKTKPRETLVEEVRTNENRSSNPTDQESRKSAPKDKTKLKSSSVEKQGLPKKAALPDISDSEDEFDHSWFDNDRLSQVISTGLQPPSNAPWLKQSSRSPTYQPNKPPGSKREIPTSSGVFDMIPTSTVSKPPNRNTVPPDLNESAPSCSVTKSNGRCPLLTDAHPAKTATILFKFKPKTFKISLCVDNAEVNTKRQKILLQELDKNGVSYNVRKLQIGDFLWIAVDSTGEELVLDVVVERKRMDDLAQSITGGRFAEQKLRLKSCGLARRVYLVETKASYLSLPEQSLNQAVVNTQVIDGFTIKKTQDIKETAAYLTILTRYLSNKYQDEELSGITDPKCTSDTQLLTFSSFSQHSVKNRVFSVGEVWLKQLARIPKISQDKAESIVKVFPTVKDMRKAADSRPNKDDIVSEIKFGFGRRKIGIAASRVVGGLFSDSPLH